MELPIIDVRRASLSFVSGSLQDPSGVQSRHSFSFGQHYDPGNVGHGRLMVHNEESVLSGRGFADHPHRNAEIVTWVMSGSLVHEDSSGHRGIVYPGLAQRMSAGCGIVHAERNDAFRLDPTQPQQPVHFVQMWLMPDHNDEPPAYQQHDLDLTALVDGWAPVASGRDPDAAVTLGVRGATFWVSVLNSGTSRLLPTAPLVHLYVARGSVDLETVGLLAEGDSVRITGDAALRATGRTEAELLVWALAS